MTNNPRKAQLYRMVLPEHVCPFGIAAKDLLESQGFEIEDHQLKTREETEAYMAEHGFETTPQTFIEGKCVGGYDELQRYFGEQA